MPEDQTRLVEDQVSRMRPELHNMLNSLAENLTNDLTREKAQLEDQVQALQARLDSLQTQLNDANSKVVDMDSKLLDAHTKLEDVNHKLWNSERRNDAMQRELEQAKIRWTGVVTTGWSEADSDREKLRRKLEKKEEELALLKLKTRTARRWMKKATFVLKEDDVVPRPESRSSVSSESSYSVQHSRRRK